MTMVSPMEIYYSALAMSPETSPIYMLYNQQIQSLPNVTSSAYLWMRSLCVFEGHRERVRLVVFSPDGKRTASASNNKTVRLWDIEKGEPIGVPLEGHHGWVLSVVFSPDGKRITSASDDKTVRLWDAEKGEPIGAPLEGIMNWCCRWCSRQMERGLPQCPPTRWCGSGTWRRENRLSHLCHILTLICKFIRCFFFSFPTQ